MRQTPGTRPENPTGPDPAGEDETLARLLRLLAQRCDASASAFWLCEPGQAPRLAASFGTLPAALPRGSALLDQAMARDALVLAEDLHALAPRDALGEALPRLRFFAGLGVHGRERRRLGVLCLLDERARSADARLPAALDDARAVLEDLLRLRADAQHDPLTGTLARGPFQDIADREWRRAMRGLSPVSVIAIEPDRLASGGAAPIDVERGLRAVALALQYSLFRPGDCVCRYDALRFVLLLPGTDAAGAAAGAERLREAVEALQLRLPGHGEGVLTISAGLDTVRGEALSRVDPDQAIDGALRALHAAQRAGGNRCATHSPDLA